MSDEQIPQASDIRYGDISLMSAPVDPEHPTFDSLLGALKEVHTGARPMEVLVRYHDALYPEMEAARTAIQQAQTRVPEAFRGTTDDQTRLGIGSLDLVRSLLDLVQVYIDEPTRANMSATVSRLLQVQGVLGGVRAMLDETARNAQ